MNELMLSGWFLLVLSALCVGSLLNVVVYRLPRMVMQQETGSYSLWLPRSHCPTCRHVIHWHDNIPLFGWIKLRGRCRHCQSPISRRYPLTELTALFLAVIAAGIIPPGLTLLGALVLGWMLLALSLIDYDHQLLPDDLTQPLLWLGLLFHLSMSHTGLADAVLGAVFGYLILWSLYQVFRFMTGREALGYGDFKLLAALGAWIGWRALPDVLLSASSAGILIALLARGFRKRPLNQPLPFGPLLALAGWGIFLYQQAFSVGNGFS